MACYSEWKLAHRLSSRVGRSLWHRPARLSL